MTKRLLTDRGSEIGNKVMRMIIGRDPLRP